MKKVLVFGSLNMDLTIECDAVPQAGQTVEGRNFFTNPGGKGGNQAVCRRQAGAAPTYMIARVGADMFGPPAPGGPRGLWGRLHLCVGKRD